MIWLGDHCQVEYKVQPKSEKTEFTEDLLVVKNTWIGTKTEKPIRPGNDRNFSVYLSGRGMNETDFLKWVYGHTPPKPYFPFVSDIYEGEVSSFVRDSTSNEILGVTLAKINKTMTLTPSGLIKTVKTNFEDKNETAEEAKEVPTEDNENEEERE